MSAFNGILNKLLTKREELSAGSKQLAVGLSHSVKLFTTLLQNWAVGPKTGLKAQFRGLGPPHTASINRLINNIVGTVFFVKL